MLEISLIPVSRFYPPSNTGPVSCDEQGPNKTYNNDCTAFALNIHFQQLIFPRLRKESPLLGGGGERTRGFCFFFCWMTGAAPAPNGVPVAHYVIQDHPRIPFGDARCPDRVRPFCCFFLQLQIMYIVQYFGSVTVQCTMCAAMIYDFMCFFHSKFCVPPHFEYRTWTFLKTAPIIFIYWNIFPTTSIRWTPSVTHLYADDFLTAIGIVCGVLLSNSCFLRCELEHT